MESIGTQSSRRRFTRNAILGSTVILSLGNRAAWSTPTACVSANTYASFTNGTASVSPTTEEQMRTFMDAVNQSGMKQQTDPKTGQVCAVPDTGTTTDPTTTDEKCYNGNGPNPHDLPLCPPK